MSRTVIAVVASILLVLSVVPGAYAGAWQTRNTEGNSEPSVPSWDGATDANGDAEYMWQGPNQEATDRIYLDGFVMTTPIVGVPHANADGTHADATVTISFQAYFGFWRDCNTDGFLGDPALGFRYPAASPTVDESICPAGSPYNDGSQVFEFLAIGPGTRDTAESGPAGQTQICPDRDGEADNQPRAQEGQGTLDGGDNVACFGGDTTYVQDDWAKVWADLDLPVDVPTPTTGVFPLPDGTFRDTNGHFKFADAATFGRLSDEAPALWPTAGDQPKNADPAEGNQCTQGAQDGGYNAGGSEGAPLTEIATNAQDAAEQGNCSPVPNLRWVDTPVLGKIAWPGHLAEDRVNDSESPGDHPTPVTAPWSHRKNDQNSDPSAQHCELQANPDDWDEDGDDANDPGTDDDPSQGDGDPFYGGSVTSPVELLRSYYGPQDGGPSLQGTISNVKAGVTYEADRAQNGQSSADCDRGGTSEEGVGSLETTGSGGQSGDALKTDSELDFAFDMGYATFNPARAPGGPATDGSPADTQACAPHGESGDASAAFNSEIHRCEATWHGITTFFNTHGLTALSPSGASASNPTYYGDVSYDGQGSDGSATNFDVSGDGDFNLAPNNQKGYFQAPSGITLDPSENLPAGEDDAHTYGDEQCDSYTAISTGGDITVQDHITAVVDDDPSTALPPRSWSCDRNGWVQTSFTNDGVQECAEAQNELLCWVVAFVGDPYDLRDVDCYDNDLGPFQTPAGDVHVNTVDDQSIAGQALAGVDPPPRSCQNLPPAP